MSGEPNQPEQDEPELTHPVLGGLRHCGWCLGGKPVKRDCACCLCVRARSYGQSQ